MENGDKKGSKSGEGGQERGQIVCVAVIAPNNALLYMRVMNAKQKQGEAEESGWRQMQEVVYNSLDVVEERVWSAKGRGGGAVGRESDGYVGCLAVVGRTCVYGSVSKSAYKTIVVVREGRDGAQHNGVRAALAAIGEALVAALMNCALTPRHALRARRFDRRLLSIAADFGDAP